MDQVSSTSSDIKPFASTLLIAIAVHILILVNWDTGWKLATPENVVKTSQSWISFKLTPAQQKVDSVTTDIAPKPVNQPRQSQKPEPAITKAADNTQVKKHSMKQNENEVKAEPIIDNASTIAEDEIQSVASSPVSVVENETKKIQYMQLLLDRIEQHKYYPRIALRRGVTGNVDVKLSLDDSGHIIQLDASSQHASLRNATRRAIESAQPLPLPEERPFFPIHLEFSISYKII